MALKNTHIIFVEEGGGEKTKDVDVDDDVDDECSLTSPGGGERFEMRPTTGLQRIPCVPEIVSGLRTEVVVVGGG